jgi:hypothetical protein
MNMIVGLYRCPLMPSVLNQSRSARRCPSVISKTTNRCTGCRSVDNGSRPHATVSDKQHCLVLTMLYVYCVQWGRQDIIPSQVARFTPTRGSTNSYCFRELLYPPDMAINEANPIYLPCTGQANNACVWFSGGVQDHVVCCY